jgi:hypothetical protein
MLDAVLPRLITRLATIQGGQITASTSDSWDIEIPLDPDAPEPELFLFRQTLQLDEEKNVTGFMFGVPGESVSDEQKNAISNFQQELMTALQREGVGFELFGELAAFVASELGGSPDLEEETIEISAGDAGGEPVFLTSVKIDGEAWVAFSTPFGADADPIWLLEQNAELTNMHFEAFEGEVSLACAWPLRILSAQRVVELVQDLAMQRERLLEDLEMGDEDEDEDPANDA